VYRFSRRGFVVNGIGLALSASGVLDAFDLFAFDSPWIRTGLVATVAGVPGVAGFDNGPRHIATFNHPTWIEVARLEGGQPNALYPDPGDIFVVDRLNEAVRLIKPDGVSTYKVASQPLDYWGEGPFLEFDFGGPFGGGLVVEPAGSGCGGGAYDDGMWVAATGKEQIVLVSMFRSVAARDGTELIEGESWSPTGLALSRGYGSDRYPYANRYLYVADTGNHTIHAISFGASFELCPQARGSLTLAGAAGVPGAADGYGPSARFNRPRGLATAPDDTVLVADSGNHTIRAVTPDGEVTTIAGEAGVPGWNDGPALQAHLRTPSGIDIDGDGVIYFSDTGNHVIRAITPDGMVSTIAGAPGESGYVDGFGWNARFAGPVGVKVDPGDGSILVADTSNNAIRRIKWATIRRQHPVRR